MERTKRKLLTKARGCADPLHRRLTPARDGLPKTLWRQLLTEKNYSRHKLYFTNQSSKIQVPLILRSSQNSIDWSTMTRKSGLPFKVSGKKRKALNPKLFNGSKFRFHSVTKSVKKFGDKEDGVATVNLGLTSYGDFLGTNYNSAISKRLLADGVAKHGNPQSYMADPLGVGALVLTEDNYFVAFQRSDVVGEFSGFVDIPGGHPEPSEVGIAIDFFNAPVTRFNGSSHVEQSPEYTIVSDKGIQGNCIKRTDYVVCGDEGDISPKPNVQIVSMKSILKELFNSILMEVHLEINIPLANLSPPKLIGILRQLGAAQWPSLHVVCN